MTRYSPHMSNVVAAATVHGMEAIAQCIKAYERAGEDRRECLFEAKTDLLAWLSDIDRAIGAELATHAAPAYGTPEHGAWLRQLGRNAFINGHMGDSGRDFDKEREIERGDTYEVNPQQFGS